MAREREQTEERSETSAAGGDPPARRGRIQFGDLDPDLRSINATEAKNTFGTVLMDVLQGERLRVNRNGRPAAVIMSYDNFRTLCETAGPAEGDDGDIMESLREIPATEAKNNFGAMLHDVVSGQRFAVRRNTRLAAVILQYNDYHIIWRRGRDNDNGADDGAARS